LHAAGWNAWLENHRPDLEKLAENSHLARQNCYKVLMILTLRVTP
jgi:hypothetical protein